QRLALLDVRAGAVQARLLIVPQNEADRAVGPDVRGGEDAGELHYERCTGAVVIRRLTPPVPVHVGADDVHLPGMTTADLGAIHLFARARSGGLRVQGAHPAVWLAQRIGVDPGVGANAAGAASTHGARGVACRPRRVRRGARRSRLIVVLQAGDVGTAVALELGLDPVHRGAVSVRALAAVAELGETLDRRLVQLEVEPRDEPGDGIRPLCGGDGRRAAGGEQNDERPAHQLPLCSTMWDE